MRNDRENSFFGPWSVALAALSFATWFLLSQTGWALWLRWLLAIACVLTLLPFFAHTFYSAYAHFSFWHSLHPGTTFRAYICTALLAFVIGAIFATVGGVVFLLLSWPLGIVLVGFIGWYAIAHSVLFSAHLIDPHSSLLSSGSFVSSPPASLPEVEITQQAERVGELCRFSVKTAGGFEFEFLVHKFNGAWRISLLRSPDYARFGRIALGHPPHRLADSAGYFVCFHPNPSASLDYMIDSAILFAALSDRYLTTGQSW